MDRELDEEQKNAIRTRPRLGKRSSFWLLVVWAVYCTIRAWPYFSDEFQQEICLAFGQTERASATVVKIWHQVQEMVPVGYEYSVGENKYTGCSYQENSPCQIGDSVPVIYSVAHPQISRAEGMSSHFAPVSMKIMGALAIILWGALVYIVWSDVRQRKLVAGKTDEMFA